MQPHNSTSPVCQPIQTSYKGYRFRSRLEARWAVFFDSLAITWEYEKEGYDLRESGWYLPDFWLPKQRTFVEIKPRIKAGEPRSFYLAGRIEQNHDWRLFMTWNDLVLGGHLFTGPHYHDFAGGSYGGHGPGHGVDFAGMAGGHGATTSLEAQQSTVLRRCLHEIDESDFVFAWIDSPDRYGTAMELGYAYARGKEVRVGLLCDEHGVVTDDLERQYWLILTLAAGVATAKTPEDAFIRLFPWATEQSEEERKCSRLSEGGSSVILIAGNPWDGEHDASRFERGQRILFAGDLGLIVGGENNRIWPLRKGHAFENSEEMLARAFATARSARFEHGETA